MPLKKKKPGVSKSKERKLKRKQEQEEIAAALAKVKSAYEHEDFMADLAPFRNYRRNSLDLTISFCRVAHMAPEDLKWTFDLMKESVKSYYMSSGWGWNDREKWEELKHESSCFLLVRDSETKILKAFVNFRFDLDEHTEVVYCYEIHLSPEVQRKGLGKFLIQILELIGHRTNMKKVVLTVFKANTTSNTFFREKLNYVDDESSPLFCDPLHEEEYTYSILSKTLVKKQNTVQVAGPASQVEQAEGGGTVAPKAVHTGQGRGTRTTHMEGISSGQSGKAAMRAATKKMSELVRMIEMVEQLEEGLEGNGSEEGEVRCEEEGKGSEMMEQLEEGNGAEEGEVRCEEEGKGSEMMEQLEGEGTGSGECDEEGKGGEMVEENGVEEGGECEEGGKGGEMVDQLEGDGLERTGGESKGEGTDQELIETSQEPEQ